MSAGLSTPLRGGLAGSRAALMVAAGLVALLIAGLLAAPLLLGEAGIRADFTARHLSPGAGHWFGTDAMGRDLLARSLQALSLSLRIGLAASAGAVAIAAGFALLSGMGRRADALAGFVTDLFLALPHLLLLMILCLTFGGGTGSVMLALALSHWPRLARVLRAELRELAQKPWLEVSRSFGRRGPWIFVHHILPHLLPQMLVGFLLMFPHAILHEAGLSFLGFGPGPGTPSVGVMLAEAMRHLSAGRWWLALFPGAMLLLLVLSFEALGSAVQRLLSPAEAQC